jgi:hypothetical protein
MKAVAITLQESTLKREEGEHIVLPAGGFSLVACVGLIQRTMNSSISHTIYATVHRKGTV